MGISVPCTLFLTKEYILHKLYNLSHLLNLKQMDGNFQRFLKPNMSISKKDFKNLSDMKHIQVPSIEIKNLYKDTHRLEHLVGCT